MEDVENVLGSLRSGLAMHGGDVELLDVDLQARTATVRLQGACVGCPMSDLTLKAGIEEAVCGLVPEISTVMAAEPEHMIDALSSTEVK